MSPAIYHTITAVIILTLFSCKEIYHPEVDSMDKVMIVDGIITDQPGSSVIKLNYYDASYDIAEQPLAGAAVYVSCDRGTIIPFYDNVQEKPGHYFASDSFEGVPGKTYTLHIETKEGEIYESGPQTIFPVASLEDIYADYGVREYIRQSHTGRYHRYEVPGIEVYTDFRAENTGILRFRTEPTLLLLYSWSIEEEPYDDEVFDPDEEPVEPDTYYCWKKIKLTDEANLNLHHFQEGYEIVKKHLLGFLPESKFLYNLEKHETINKKILIIRYFTLNHDTHEFYAAAHNQVTSDNKLFDPIVSQLPTNIRCTSHPKKPVAGFFEASSTLSETHALTEYPEYEVLIFQRIEDLEHLPDKGYYLNEIPEFWRD